MRKARILLILGIWLAILPYLGFPYSWKGVLTVITGLGLIIFSYVLYRDYKSQEGEPRIFDNFQENSDFYKNENDSVGDGEVDISIEDSQEEWVN